MRIVCDVCPNHCNLADKQIGFCRARQNIDNKIVSINYGKVVSIALDPIEKKPLYHFKPNSNILSVGSFGCNLRCPFCQNYSISMSDQQETRFIYISKEELVDKAIALKEQDCIGLAFTYNEPLIGWEYVYDTAKLAKGKGLSSVVVTNGYINKNILEKVCEYVDAMNIDLKSFRPQFYENIHGNIDIIKENIMIASNKCHLEVTFLVIPNENDTPTEIIELSKWLAQIDADIPLHISRFYPAYKYANLQPTPVKTIYEFVKIASKYLKYVYPGNC